MNCQACRENMPRLLQGTLPPALVAALGSHLAGCEACRLELEEEQALTHRLREAARYRASEHLRAQVQRELQGEQRRRAVRRVPGKWVAVAALLLLTVGISFLFLWVREGTLETLVAEVTTHHQRMVLQKEFRGLVRGESPLPSKILPLVRDRLKLPVKSIFLGNPALTLVLVRATYLLNQKAVVFVYADSSGRISILLILQGRGLEIPKSGRMQVTTFRPYHTRVDSMNVLVWKQKDIAYSLVAQVEDQEMADLFLKIRKAL